MPNGDEKQKRLGGKSVKTVTPSEISKKLQEKQVAGITRKPADLSFGAVAKTISQGGGAFFGVQPRQNQFGDNTLTPAPAAAGAQAQTQASGAQGGRSALPGATNTGGGIGSRPNLNLGGSQDAPGLTAQITTPSNLPTGPSGGTPTFGSDFAPRGTTTTGSQNLGVSQRLSDRFRSESLTRLGLNPAQVQERELASEEARVQQARASSSNIPGDVRVPTAREERLNPGSTEVALARNTALGDLRATESAGRSSSAASAATSASRAAQAQGQLQLQTQKAAASQDLNERKFAFEQAESTAKQALEQGKLQIELGKLDLQGQNLLLSQSKEVREGLKLEIDTALDEAELGLKEGKFEQANRNQVIALGTERRKLAAQAAETGDTSILGQMNDQVDAFVAGGGDVDVAKAFDPNFAGRAAQRINSNPKLSDAQKTKLLGELGVQQESQEGKLF